MVAGAMTDHFEFVLAANGLSVLGTGAFGKVYLGQRRKPATGSSSADAATAAAASVAASAALPPVAVVATSPAGSGSGGGDGGGGGGWSDLGSALVAIKELRKAKMSSEDARMIRREAFLLRQVSGTWFERPGGGFAGVPAFFALFESPEAYVAATATAAFAAAAAAAPAPAAAFAAVPPPPPPPATLLRLLRRLPLPPRASLEQRNNAVCARAAERARV